MSFRVFHNDKEVTDLQQFAVQTNVATWDEFHRYQPTGDVGKDEAWLEDFNSRVQGFGCTCRPHWRALMKEHPVEWERFDEWRVDRHNDVNRRLGKPEVTYEQASAIWQTAGIAALR